jgi:hypothetical protein
MCLINTLYTLTELFWDLGMPHQNRAQVGDPGSGFSKGSTKTGLGKCPLVCSKSPKRDIYRFFFDSKKVNVLFWWFWTSPSSICLRLYPPVVGWCSIRTFTNPWLTTTQPQNEASDWSMIDGWARWAGWEGFPLINDTSSM